MHEHSGLVQRAAESSLTSVAITNLRGESIPQLLTAILSLSTLILPNVCTSWFFTNFVASISALNLLNVRLALTSILQLSPPLPWPFPNQRCRSLQNSGVCICSLLLVRENIIHALKSLTNHFRLHLSLSLPRVFVCNPQGTITVFLKTVRYTSRAQEKEHHFIAVRH